MRFDILIKNSNLMWIFTIYFIVWQGIDCCSTSAIAFHYISDLEMYTFDFLTNHVKLASSRDKLPPKFNFEDIRRRLNVTTTTAKTTTTTENDALDAFY